MQAAFPGCAEREGEIRICLCRAKGRGCTVAGHRFSRAPVYSAKSPKARGTMMNVSPRRETRLIFCLHALPTMRRGNSSARDHTTGHARRKDRCYYRSFLRIPGLNRDTAIGDRFPFSSVPRGEKCNLKGTSCAV